MKNLNQWMTQTSLSHFLEESRNKRSWYHRNFSVSPRGEGRINSEHSNTPLSKHRQEWSKRHVSSASRQKYQVHESQSSTAFLFSTPAPLFYYQNTTFTTPHSSTSCSTLSPTLTVSSTRGSLRGQDCCRQRSPSGRMRTLLHGPCVRGMLSFAFHLTG